MPTLSRPRRSQWFCRGGCQWPKLLQCSMTRQCHYPSTAYPSTELDISLTRFGQKLTRSDSADNSSPSVPSPPISASLSPQQSFRHRIIVQSRKEEPLSPVRVPQKPSSPVVDIPLPHPSTSTPPPLALSQARPVPPLYAAEVPRIKTRFSFKII